MLKVTSEDVEQMLKIKSYAIKEQVYLGNKFTIYRGERESDKRKVIIKTCRSDHPTSSDLATLQHEYQILNQVSNPGVIQVYDLIKNSHSVMIIMEDTGGKSLHEYLSNKPISLNGFFKIAVQIVDSLSSLHAKNIIHKDINPYNIIIDSNSLSIKLVDFSIASQLTEESSYYTQANKVEGTLAYLSPEQTGRMNCPIDYRADFYALGITFYEMLTGKTPFKGSDPLEWIHYHLAQTPAPISELNPRIPNQISAIIAKLLAKSPEDRYQSGAGIKADILQCQEQWNNEHRIDDFELGKKDLSTSLVISRKLYGREKQVQEILHAFDKIKEGKTELFLISGYSGIGKTSLVNEVHKPIVESYGNFSSGKFEQFHHDVPYAAIVQAFRKLVKQIFCEPQHRIDIWREAIVKAVGVNGQVIIQSIPEVELLIGKQPPLAQLPPTQERSRFEVVFCDFVQCFATYDHPLVIFLDDLQWADRSSYDLLLLLLRNAQLKFFMMIGAYRDNEVTLDHPLLELLHELKKSNAININQVQLTTLDINSIEKLISDSLNLPTTEIAELANLIREKTAGNPFFVNTFLSMLYQDHHLSFNLDLLSWQWNMNAIKELAITSNVVDLLVFKIERLPEIAQQALKIAACLGTQFDLLALAQIGKSTQYEISQALWPALEKNLLIPIGDNYKLAKAHSDFELLEGKIIYKFAHDRVQQAAYSLISEDERKQTHLSLGRILLQSSSASELEENVFDVVNHFNYSLDLIVDENEKLAVAELNLQAGGRAKASAAYEPAISCFKNAMNLLGTAGWDTHYALAIKANVGHAECLHLIGKYDEADEEFSIIVSNAKTKIDKAQISMQQVLSYTIQVKFEEAITAGLEGLKVLGMNISRQPSSLRVGYELFKTMWMMRKFTPEEIIHLPTVENPEQILLTELVERIAIASYLGSPNLLAFITLKRIQHCLKEGLTQSIAPLFVLYGTMHIVAFKNLDYGYKIAKLAMKIAERFDDLRVQATVYFSAATIPLHWKKPYKVLLPHLIKSFNMCRQIGDLIYTNYVISLIPLTMLNKGDEIDEIDAKVKSMKVIADFTRNIDGLSNLAVFINVLAILKGEKNIQALHELVNDFVTGKIQHSIPVAFANTGTLILMACYVMEQWEDAEVMFNRMHVYHNLQALSPTFINTEYTLFMGLVALNLYRVPANNWLKKFKYRSWIRRALKRFSLWSKHCPENYLAKYLMLTAGLNEIKGQATLAITNYDGAMQSARDNGLLHIEAIILQQIANGCVTRKHQLSSKLYLTEEIYSYNRWGALGKCKFLEATNPDWLTNKAVSVSQHTTVTTDYSSANMNILSIFKFTQAISSEIQLDKLLQKLLLVLLQSAGAQRGMLISKSSENWYIEAEGTSGQEKIYLSPTELLKGRNDLPLNLIQYVIQTQEIWIVPSINSKEQPHIEDPYLEQYKPKSFLIMPITYQGQLKSLLYLENRSVSNAFTVEHTQTLGLLASQAAISLENARLYYQATHDPLTGLANRNLLNQLFNLATHKARRNLTQIAVLFLDLDGFKKINDTLGHEVGDKLLQYVGDQIKKCIREHDLAVRLGGDEFVAILENITDINVVRQIADHILASLSDQVIIGEHTIRIGTSVGISLYPDDGEDIQSLLKKADLALYEVKSQGKGHYQFYSASITQKLSAESLLEQEIKNAISNNELCIYYQPIYSSNNREVTQFEALVRWNHPTRGILEAKHFIPIIEKTNFIILLGEWVLENVCLQLRQWIEAGKQPLPVAVNVSSLQFKDSNVGVYVESLLKEYALPAHLIEIELTESAFMSYTDKVVADMKHLKSLGVKLIMDDFGTYYSSLTYLKRFPFDTIKIDQSFVHDIEKDENNRLLIQAMIAMAHSLKLKVVAEGVESSEQIEFLKNENVDQLQGNYLSYPLNATDTLKII